MKRQTLTLTILALLAVLLSACAPQIDPLDLEGAAVPAEGESGAAEGEIQPEDQTAPDGGEAAFELPEQAGVETLFPAAPTAQGDALIVTGQVLDLSGQPVPGAGVEFWQADANGIYKHPGDGRLNDRDMGFQFFGQAVADEGGVYVFRTIYPGNEGVGRPPHIHLRVTLDGAELLVSQFYFAADREEYGFGSELEALLLQVENSADPEGNPVLVASKALIVDTGAGGDLSPTPPQQLGPFYPVEDVSLFDNDLAVVE
jgi:protocatechuate 3,4-dioxygenase beta subunit